MDELKKDENPYSIEVAKRKSIWTLSINPDEGGDELAKTEYDAFDKRITRLGFTGNPYKTDSTLTGLYYIKPSGLPEPILKRISTTDSLVGSILLARQKQVSQFGRRQEDRLSLGFGIIPDKRIFDKMSKEEKEDIEKKIEKACKVIETCGKIDGYLRTEAMNFSQWLEESARSALIVGRIATEIINDNDGYFHSFRPLDAGTVFPTVKTASANQLEDIRERSISLLQNIYGGSRSDYVDAVDGSYDWDRYEWIQLLDGKAIQCFTDDQLRCKNFYPVSDFEWFGFPVTPLDLAINEVLTHISITAHNKLFFQSGRAARGMIIIQSDDVDAQVLLQIRNEFMAAVNSVNNCIDGSSTIWTQESGRISVVDYLDGSKEKLCTIWTGKEWNPALVYKTSVKQLAVTQLSNNVTLKTSPDHRFRVINDSGEPDWKRQEDLKIGDLVLSNRDKWNTKPQLKGFDTVIVLDKYITDTYVEMYDVSVYEPTHDCKGHACKSPEHAFMCDGVLLANSHRMPVFGIGPEDKLTWQPIDNSSRDMEYQYLSDNNARAILSAFQMSPEELPGMAHLSRGTNNQSLSECLDLSSRVYQIDGYNTIGSILGDEEEVFTEIWDGREYIKCRIFKSGLKRSIKTITDNGLEIITSPDHKFRIFDGSKTEWRIQQELVIGDFLIIDDGSAMQITEIIDLDNVVEMADVEMFNESHGFIANGFYVHNSNKEYLLEAHRDTGIRPLLLNLEEFVDQQILPLIDFELSKVAHFKLLGLDAKTLDQEDADETRNLSLDGSINHVRQTKQRPPIPKELAGDLPLNQAWWAVVQQMVPFGVIQEVMFGVKDASKDPSKQFYQNPFWFQYQQMLQAQKQMEAQQQQLAQTAQNPQQKP